MKKLIIAEKPSVAETIAKVLGAEKRQGFFDCPEYLISWCKGHLVAPADPETYDPAFAKWSLEALPIIPETWQYEVFEETAPQFDTLAGLMNRSDVEELVEATDAGREGELIFRLVYQMAGCKKTFRRLWLQSMEPVKIKAALADLRPSSEYDTLYASALARQKADWLVGINLTRLYTKLYNHRLPVGRVQTRVLALIVQRQAAIDCFTPATYYNVVADCGNFRAKKRLDSKVAAEAIAQSCGDTGVIVSFNRTEEEKAPPKLFNLTGLQKAANQLLGYSAQQTLDYAQSLYEHGLATYPRAPSKYITSDMADTAQSLINNILAENLFPCLYQPELSNVAQVINDTKVEDHPAILPTIAGTSRETLDKLPSGERNILLLLCGQLLAATYAPLKSSSVNGTLAIGAVEFEISQKIITDYGWQTVLTATAAACGCSQKAPSTSRVSLPELNEGDTVAIQGVRCEEGKTKPPEAYSDATILSAMEHDGQDLEEDVQRLAMKSCGLGTEATRAAMLEKLISSGYVKREKKKLLPTSTGAKLISVVTPELTSAETTGTWEAALAAIKSGTEQPSNFLSEIENFVREVIPRAKGNVSDEDKEVFSSRHSFGSCPKCGKPVYELPMSYSCSSGKDGCGFILWKKIAQQKVSPQNAEKLLQNGESNLIKGFVSTRTGKTFDAYLIIKEDGTVGFQFPQKASKGKSRFRRK